MNEHIKSVSQNAKNLEDIQCERLIDDISSESRIILGKASRTKNGWFKSVSAMEGVALDIIGPDLQNANAEFRATIDDVYRWIADVE